jgi:NDP-sugar pyrophosphorylase family protein
MKAMILAAGLGTRLRPLTDTRPKALVEVAGRTLLEITLTRLRSFGINDVIVNVHHFADMVVDYLKSRNNFGMRIEISREDDLLLDTGGGLKKAAWFFLENARHLPLVYPDPVGAIRHSPTEPFLLHNVDVISNIDLRRMLQFHNEHGALATLAVQSRKSSRLLLFNEHLQLSGRAGSTATPGCASQNAATPNPSAVATRHSPLPLAFSGIHVISPRLLPMLTEDGAFSIIDAYLRLAAQGEKILAFRADEYYWRDLGRLADLSQASLDLHQRILL